MLILRSLALVATATLAASIAFTAKPAAPAAPVAPVPNESTPSHMIEIVTGTPYTVPDGQAFIAIALGTTQINHGASLWIDGVVDVHKNPNNTELSMVEIPKHKVIPSGSVITVTSTYGGRCWGYLVVLD